MLPSFFCLKSTLDVRFIYFMGKEHGKCFFPFSPGASLAAAQAFQLQWLDPVPFVPRRF